MNPETHLATTAVHQTETLLYFTLLQLTVIVLAGRVGGAVARRTGQSPAVGEIIVGILLGPSLFGLVAPALFGYVFRSAPPEPLTILSQIGLILLMFQIGLEFDFSHLTDARNRTAVTRVAASTLALPSAGCRRRSSRLRPAAWVRRCSWPPRSRSPRCRSSAGS